VHCPFTDGSDRGNILYVIDRQWWRRPYTLFRYRNTWLLWRQHPADVSRQVRIQA